MGRSREKGIGEVNMFPWRYVWLIALVLVRSAGAVTIEKLLPFTPAADGVRIQAVLKGDSTAGPLEVRGIIAPLGGGEPAWKGPIGQIDLPADTSKSVEQLVEKLPVKPWSPGSPNLYNLTVIVLRNNNQVAEKTVRFGFRSFESKD